MPRRPLGSLGAMVRKKRGSRKLREVAKEIGIGAATLLRVENGRIPDITTFGRLCKWLEVDPGAFLGFERRASRSGIRPSLPVANLLVSAHLRADRTPDLKTIQALAKMILFAAKQQPAVEGPPEDGNA